MSDIADALEEFADIDEAEGGNPHVIATERSAAHLIRKLTEALEPFAAIADEVAKNNPGWDHDGFEISRGMSFRHFRAASAALHPHHKEQ